jgi:hypothetical protein
MQIRLNAARKVLYDEAERRVRAGESRAEVARALHIPVSTVRDWALQGGWRRKDLGLDHDPGRGEALLNQIIEMNRAERETGLSLIEGARQKAAAFVDRMKASSSTGGLPNAQAVPPRQLAIGLAHSLLEQGRLAEAERAARFAIRFAQAEEVCAVRDESRWRVDRENVMKWWREQITMFNELVGDVNRLANELADVRSREESMMADKCCPACSKPMDFFPPEMEDEADQLVADQRSGIKWSFAWDDTAAIPGQSPPAAANTSQPPSAANSD